MHNIFSLAEIRAISELRVSLVPLNLLKLSNTCISFADSSKAVQILLIISSPGDIYVKNLTFTLYFGGGVCVCVGGGGGRGRGHNQDVI